MQVFVVTAAWYKKPKCNAMCSANCSFEFDVNTCGRK